MRSSKKTRWRRKYTGEQAGECAGAQAGECAGEQVGDRAGEFAMVA